ncbi:hypothetical protein B0H13DRAFT_1862591 [Mycena leptocephala]|nr:hypothetical protein B0H13DRAFT_1862591 [Mycena leptocephala]
MAEYEEEVKQKADVLIQDIPVTSFSVESLISLGQSGQEIAKLVSRTRDIVWTEILDTRHRTFQPGRGLPSPSTVLESPRSYSAPGLHFFAPVRQVMNGGSVGTMHVGDSNPVHHHHHYAPGQFPPIASDMASLAMCGQRVKEKMALKGEAAEAIDSFCQNPSSAERQVLIYAELLRIYHLMDQAGSILCS